MGKCPKCGVSMGLLNSDICDKCLSTIKAEKERQKSETENKYQLALEEQKTKKDQLSLQKFQEFKGKINNGEKFYLYDTIYVPVDSLVIENKVNDEFSISLLRKLGLLGWEVVGIVPRTLGIGLSNSVIGTMDSAVSWGAGLGGNIIGAYIILKIEPSQSNLSDEYLLDYFKRNINDFLSQDESQMLSEIIQNATS